MSEKYPNLLNELNDSSSQIPAYARFQDPVACLLRDDLRQVKEQHFRKSYDLNLKSHMKDLADVQFRGGRLDSQKYFKIKYFINKEQKDKILKDRMQELSEQLVQSTAAGSKNIE